MEQIKLFVETGEKKTFVGAVDWPGWCRSGRNEAKAIKALLDYGPRYAQLLHHQGMDFEPPVEGDAFVIVERIEGNTSTDFGVPAIMLEGDTAPITQAEFEHFQTILKACWHAFDVVIEQATGQALKEGPRGGGRELDKIIDHVLAADLAYLRRLAWRHKRDVESSLVEELGPMRQSIQNALLAAINGGLPKYGPRGGALWPPRYFVRRVAWHVLDHTWEIEDRIILSDSA